MMKCFILSIGTGIIVGIPFGVAGAMVADSALQRDKRKTYFTTIAAILGDLTLACLAGLFSRYIMSVIDEHKRVIEIVTGIVLILLAGVLAFNTYVHWRQKKSYDEENERKLKKINSRFAHTAPAVTTYLITVLHPANFIMVAALAAYVHSFCEETFQTWIFAPGLALGSLCTFGFSAFLFWKIGKRAGQKGFILRYILATVIFVLGILIIAAPQTVQNDFLHETIGVSHETSNSNR